MVAPAQAHPHIFIDARAVIVFNDAGEISAIKNVWTFDEAYSAWAVQGLDTNHDGVITEKEAQPLADDNMKGLADYSFYTFINEQGIDGQSFKLHAGLNPRMDYDGHRQTLTFTALLDHPYRIKDTAAVAINDPEYYVAITFKDKGAVALENAPKGCSFSMQPPRQMNPTIAEQLYELPADVTVLPPDLAAAVKGVQGEILVHCPAALTAALARNAPADGQGNASAPQPKAKSALDAANLLASAKAIPFNGPPVETSGIRLPNWPIVLWLKDQQREFYAALTDTLVSLRQNNRAFWVLGAIAFIYGTFHAAGPGHGKVVISSYVLANEQQLRKGLVLSFVAAMIQAVTAVVFIGIAAGVLRMGSIAMSGAANAVVILSYGLVAMLGFWLIVRHLMGWGHHHGHRPRIRPGAPRAPQRSEHEHRQRVHSLLYADAGEPALATAGHSPAYAGAQGASGHHHADAGDAHDHGHLHQPNEHHGHDHDGHSHDSHDHHDHVHAITPGAIRGNWREQFGVVMAVGLRPCSGALIVLVFALSQGVLWAGIAATFLMGLGTAITVATLATLAVTAKGMTQRLFGGQGRAGPALVWWAELAGAFIVFGFGIILMMASF